jgi:hypothetical protein
LLFHHQATLVPLGLLLPMLAPFSLVLLSPCSSLDFQTLVVGDSVVNVRIGRLDISYF